MWSITKGTEEEQIEEAIQKTKTFFNNLGLHTQLSHYDINIDDIDTIISQLEAHGMTQLGEHQDITLEISKKILINSL